MQIFGETRSSRSSLQTPLQFYFSCAPGWWECRERHQTPVITLCDCWTLNLHENNLLKRLGSSRLKISCGVWCSVVTAGDLPRDQTGDLSFIRRMCAADMGSVCLPGGCGLLPPAAGNALAVDPELRRAHLRGFYCVSCSPINMMGNVFIYFD